MSEIDKAVNFLIKESKNFAKAKADRVYIENFLRSKKSLLMQESKSTVMAAQERDAYAHPDYIELLEGLRAATEIEESLKWKLTAAQARIEIWKANCYADNRQDKVLL